jgi:hypothetical protein
MAVEPVDPPLARDLIVFGRGHEPGRVDRLSAASLARVDRVVAYVAAHADSFAERPARIVFSGGWAQAAGAVRRPPPVELREGNLMAAAAAGRRVHGRPLTAYAELHAESSSPSTLENVLLVHDAGFFAGAAYDAGNPLGLVAHAGHVERAAYYCAKVFGLKRSALLHILAVGEDQLSAGLPEPVMNAATRLACLGARSPRALRRRERWLCAAASGLRRR